MNEPEQIPIIPRGELRTLGFAPSPPEQLSGPYEPIFIQSALQYFFENAVLPIYSGNTMINLMDYFPMLQQGYALQETAEVLFNVYLLMHNLMDVSTTGNTFLNPDDLIFKAFDSDIPAAYYIDNNDDKFDMRQGITNKFIQIYLNTFQALNISRGAPEFYQDEIQVDPTVHYIIDLNVWDSDEFPDLDTYVRDEDFTKVLIDEYMIAKELSEIMWMATSRQKRIYPIFGDRVRTATIMFIAMKYKFDNLLQRLLADPRTNKLTYAVISSSTKGFVPDTKPIIAALKTTDPRDNDYEAYRVAKELRKVEVIKLIEDAIIERDLLEKKTFQTMMIPLGESDVPQSEMFHRYSRYLVNK